MERIRIALPHRGAGVAPVLCAIEGRFFAAAGLDAELVPYNGHPNTLRALIAGEAEFTNAVGPELLLANLRHGGDAVVIASAISRSAQQVSARPGLTTREQLRGRRWGVNVRNDADECAIVMAFERWGWDPEKDAEIVVVGTEGPRLDLLLDASRVDVAIMHAPEPFQAERRGWTLVEDLGRLDVAFQNSCAATTRRMLESRPETVLRYVRAFCRAVWRFRTDAAFGVDVLRKYTGERDEEVLGATWVLFARLMGGMMFPSVEGMRNASRVLERLGALPAAVPPEEAVDLGPVAALEQERFFDRLMGLRG
jgi:ABC-type nitrate/sulfonate/bicarbonate transport system substrate-binding protein